MIHIAVEACPRPASVTRAVQSAAARRDELFTILDENMVNVVMQSIASLGPCVSTIIADMDAADFDARDNPFGSIGIGTKTANVGLIPMAGKSPLLARGQVLQALQFAP